MVQFFPTAGLASLLKYELQPELRQDAEAFIAAFEARLSTLSNLMVGVERACRLVLVCGRHTWRIQFQGHFMLELFEPDSNRLRKVSTPEGMARFVSQDLPIHCSA